MPAESAVDHAIGGERRARGGLDGGAGQGDRAIAELAQHQHGLVTREQLLEAGLGRRAIDHRLQRRWLQPIHRGVYAAGHSVLSAEGRWTAAVLAGGRGAVLSQRSAAALWGIRATTSARIDVTVPRWRRPRTGVRFHESEVARDELTTLRGIPVTTVPRTLLDLAAVVEPRVLERAVEQAEVLRLSDALSLVDLVDRYPGRRGLAAIKAILAAQCVGSAITRSELEDRFLALLDQAGLPRPDVNRSVRVRGRWIEGDCVWLPQRMIAELDGHAFHATAAAFERDRSRDRVLQAAGWRVVRITWRQLHDDTAAVVADLCGLLGADGYAS